MYSMQFAPSSKREDLSPVLTRIPTGKESLGSAKNSGNPSPVEPGRNSLSRSRGLVFGASSALGIRSKILPVTELVLVDKK